MIKVFIILLIFLLEQSAVCNESFRINRAVPEPSVEKSDVETVKKDSAQISLNEQKKQQHAVLSGGTTVFEGNKVVDNITLKQIDVNKTTNTTELRKEVSM